MPVKVTLQIKDKLFYHGDMYMKINSYELQRKRKRECDHHSYSATEGVVILEPEKNFRP